MSQGKSALAVFQQANRIQANASGTRLDQRRSRLAGSVLASPLGLRGAERARAHQFKLLAAEKKTKREAGGGAGSTSRLLFGRTRLTKGLRLRRSRG